MINTTEGKRMGKRGRGYREPGKIGAGGGGVEADPKPTAGTVAPILLKAA